MRYVRLIRAICHSIKRSFVVWQMNEISLSGKELYSCAGCGMARSEPCEHWQKMLDEAGEDSQPRPCAHINKIGHEWSSTCMDCGETWQHGTPEYTTIGVAAPLEPTPPNMGKMGNSDHIREVTNMIPVKEWREKYYLAHRMHDAVIDKELFECQMLEAYGAAVSKNATTKMERERDAAVVTLRAMCGDDWQTMGGNFAESLASIESREARILELEKEIAALRETK